MQRMTAVLVMLASLAAAGCSKKEEGKGRAEKEGVDVFYLARPAEDLSPEAAVWKQAPEAEVSLRPQDVADPGIRAPGSMSMLVRAVCDGERIAFRIGWQDETRDDADIGDRFSDAVAVQLPPSSDDMPNPMMGEEEGPVLIHFWKASYQRRVELGDWNLRQDHPHATVDHYPFQGAPEAQRAALEAAYETAESAGNPLARKRRSSVDDLTAEGYGHLQPLATQASQGWSGWASGRWTVVISRPLKLGEGELLPGDDTFVAFAVWDGARKQVGSRKMRTAWVPLRVGGKP